ncbi:MAG TPA: hypothetical protein VF756_26740 [Thermoanaerobaculia bacterium]
MRAHFAFAVALLVSSQAAPLFAQGRCLPSDTIAGCFDRYLTPDAVIQPARAEQKQELMTEPTGLDTGGANLATNKKNLLPLLALSGLLGQSDADEEEGTMVFDLNFLVPGLAEKGSKNAQFEAVVNTEPEIAESLRNALPEEDRDELAGQLEGKLGGLSDYAIRLTYNHSNRSHGRSFAQYAKRFDALSRAAVDTVTPLAKVVALQTSEITNLIAQNQNIFTGENAENTRFDALPPDVSRRARLLVEEKAREIAEREDAATRAMNEFGLASFHKLLDNQPQFHLTADKKLRESLVGPEELAVKVTYEWSAVNFNAAMSEDCHRALDVSQPDNNKVRSCLSEYESFVKGNADGIENGNRFSFSGEYVEIDEDTIDAGLDGIAPIVLEKSHKLVIYAGWSRDFTLGDGEPISFDLVAEYEDISDDPLRRDRGIASLTFTRQFGGVSIPFGIVYATHSEFLTDVDEQLSAHVGLRFNAGGNNDDE